MITNACICSQNVYNISRRYCYGEQYDTIQSGRGLEITGDCDMQ